MAILVLKIDVPDRPNYINDKTVQMIRDRFNDRIRAKYEDKIAAIIKDRFDEWINDSNLDEVAKNIPEYYNEWISAINDGYEVGKEILEITWQ